MKQCDIFFYFYIGLLISICYSILLLFSHFHQVVDIINCLIKNFKKKASGDDKATEASTKNNKTNVDKKKSSEKESAEKEAECNIIILNVQVGVVRKAWRHPSADR